MTSVEAARTDPRGAPVIGRSRARVLAALQAATGLLGVGEVAALTGLHPNTARFHLDALIELGAVRRTDAPHDGPGRPRSLYGVCSDRTGGPRSYRLLAEILAGYLARSHGHPAAAAIEAGEHWGRSTVAGAHCPPGDPGAATRQLMRTLDEIGFAPEAEAGGGSDRDTGRVVAHQCPFQDVARTHPAVACGVHLGIMRGVLDGLGAPIRAEGLQPLVAPNRCVTVLSPRA